MPVELDEFKSFIGMPSTVTAQDGSLQRYLNGAWGCFIREVGRDIDQTTYPAAPIVGNGDSGLYSGNGMKTLRLRQRPVIANGMQVWVDPTGYWAENPDGSFATATLLVYGTDYALPVDGCLPGRSRQGS